jgi:hypothetical protein
VVAVPEISDTSDSAPSLEAGAMMEAGPE